MHLHAVLIVRDLYTPLSPLISEIHAEGVPYSNIVLLNSGSTSAACLSKLKAIASLGCRVLTIQPSSLRFGPYVLWLDRTLQLPDTFWSFPFLLTDPDLDLAGLPRGWLRILLNGLNEYRWATKIGLGLRTDDLSLPLFNDVIRWEEQLSHRFPYGFLNNLFHLTPHPSRICPTDTTLCLYRPQRQFSTLAIRLEGPFQVRHLPWYPSFVITEEYSYYQNHKDPGIGMWSTT